MRILGISCFYHDAAAALLVNGEIVAAAQEERFTRRKHDERFPINAITYCLGEGRITTDDLDYIVFYDKPLLKFERILQTYFNVWPRGVRSFIKAMRVWLKEKLWVEYLIAKKLRFKGKVLFTEHHYSHAASAYHCSGFDDAVIVTMDGVGEWDTTTIGYGKTNKLVLTHTIHFPHSLGLLYSAFTYYLGFKVNSAEYKVMGLAPYGNYDLYYDRFKNLITVAEDGSFRLNTDYFAYEYGLAMTNERFHRLFGGPPRTPKSGLTQRHKDIAAALQRITNEIVLKIVRHAKSLYPSENLCLSGGVALNCVANGKILESELFKRIYVQPAAGDAGGSIGAACFIYFDALGNKKVKEVMKNVFLGPAFDNEEIKNFLDNGELESKYGAKIDYKYLPDEELLPCAAGLIAGNYVVGWFDGRMEFGPRALGSRSILADARKKENWQRVNLKIKFRENFRPLAPTVLEEEKENYFTLKGHESPYMLLTAPVKKDVIPAVTHVDNSARIQTINEAQNPKFYGLLKEFFRQTKCPVIINTSFNIRGEPIVRTAQDAFTCFANTDIDYLVLGNYVISKKDNPMLGLKRDHKGCLNKFDID